jgi:hypothetical protein
MSRPRFFHLGLTELHFETGVFEHVWHPDEVYVVHKSDENKNPKKE